MAYRDDFLNSAKEQLEAVTASSCSFGKSWQAIAAESSEYAKKSFENGSAFFEKLRGAKSFESVLQLQSEFAKSSSDRAVDYMTKVGELYSNLARQAFRLDTAVSKVQGSKD
ncbi:MAG TPA: phasin family protein [Methylocella sp.]|nr:phasin family protein [Methylocella sp.]